MKLNRLYLLVILGAAIALLALFTTQFFIALFVLVFLVIILILRDTKVWIELLVDQIASSRTSVPDKSVAELNGRIAKLEERLDALEKKNVR